MTDPGRLLGIDHGLARIGVAISDPLQMVARPLIVIEHTSQREDIVAIKNLVADSEVVKLVVGLPTTIQGGLSSQARLIVAWAQKLARVVASPIVFWDESNSTQLAEKISQTNKKKRRSLATDDVAAAVILQDYLDSVKGINHEPGQSLETLAPLL